ncbi:MAG: hypothetical protein OXU20_05260 [Myxococcales bacterium]|nr:hypothetical protein [Myxococcales bacterium]MDD9972012.1 hypothetical protein [Myxococcales bacterium]
MPWLESEHPSDDQLRAYLDECCPWIGQPEPAIEGHLAIGEAWSLGASELHEWARGALWNALKRLDALPRSDPFWVGTNNRPTVPKLVEHAAGLLERDPDDVAALETQAAIAVPRCPTDFASDAWLRLWQLGSLDVRLGVIAALWCELNCGSALREKWSGDRGFAEAARPHVMPLEQAASDELRVFATRLGA